MTRMERYVAHRPRSVEAGAITLGMGRRAVKHVILRRRAPGLWMRMIIPKALQTRMRVLTPATVMHFGKTGRMLRQMQSLGRSKRLQGDALPTATTPEKKPFLCMISRLKHLWRRRKELGL